MGNKYKIIFGNGNETQPMIFRHCMEMLDRTDWNDIEQVVLITKVFGKENEHVLSIRLVKEIYERYNNKYFNDKWIKPNPKQEIMRKFNITKIRI